MQPSPLLLDFSKTNALSFLRLNWHVFKNCFPFLVTLMTSYSIQLELAFTIQTTHGYTTSTPIGLHLGMCAPTYPFQHLKRHPQVIQLTSFHVQMQEGARWWVDLFGCCPPVGRMFSGIFSYNDNTANEVVATGGARVLEFDMLDPHGGATGGARVLGFDMLDPHGVTSTLVPLLNAEGRNV
jgi:hypothetical protein